MIFYDKPHLVYWGFDNKGFNSLATFIIINVGALPVPSIQTSQGFLAWRVYGQSCQAILCYNVYSGVASGVASRYILYVRGVY